MKLTVSQKEVLIGIEKNLELGDITIIADKVKMSRVYVANVLNKNTQAYNENIIKAAIEFLVERKQGRKEILKPLTV
jgi:hypothetical protein